MMASPPLMYLTWAGLDVALDLIAAQCLRLDRTGVYGASAAGQVLAVALSDRLSLSLLQLPMPGMVLVDIVATEYNEFTRLAEGTEDIEAWAWVDATGDHRFNSVLKVHGACTGVVMPWQETPTIQMEPFLRGFHD